MTKQPKALRLADDIDPNEQFPAYWADQEAASKELRRLHEVNQELLEALKSIEQSTNESWTADIASAAIAKATGEQA